MKYCTVPTPLHVLISESQYCALLGVEIIVIVVKLSSLKWPEGAVPAGVWWERPIKQHPSAHPNSTIARSKVADFGWTVPVQLVAPQIAPHPKQNHQSKHQQRDQRDDVEQSPTHDRMITCSGFGIRGSGFGVQRPMFNIQPSTFKVRRWTFKVQRSTSNIINPNFPRISRPILTVAHASGS